MQFPPIARTTDPGTSHHAAALAALHSDTCRARVFDVVRDSTDEGLTHEQIVRAVQVVGGREGWPPYTDSGIRTRCHELAVAGLLERVPHAYGLTRAGGRSTLWRVPADVLALEGVSA